MIDKDIKILYSHDIFSTQIVGGISRYIYELFKRNKNANIPLLYSQNLYLNKFRQTRNFRGKARMISSINEAYERYLLATKGYDIYHLSYYKNLKKPKNSLVILTIHDMIHELYKDSYFKHDRLTSKLKRQNCELADGIIAISKQSKDDLIRLFNIKEEKIKVIYHGHSLQKIEVDLPFKSGYILFVGFRGSYKNFTNFANAVSLLKKQNLTRGHSSLGMQCDRFAKFRIVADSSLVNPLKFSKNSKSTTANIRMLGGDSAMESLESRLDSSADSTLDSIFSKDFNSLNSTQSVESNKINPHEAKRSATLKACSGEEGVIKGGEGATLRLSRTPFSPFKNGRLEDDKLIGDSKGLKDSPLISKDSNIKSNNFKDIRVLCVGAEFSKSELELLKKLDIEENFISYSAKDDELYSIYANAACFVFPSFYEGFGIPILESFFANCPTLLSDIAVFREIASDCALYFNPNEPSSIANAISKILENKALSKELISKASKRIELFSWDRTYKETMEFYKLQITNRGGVESSYYIVIRLYELALTKHSPKEHSSLGMQCNRFAKFRIVADFSLASYPKFSKNYHSHTANIRMLGEEDSNGMESVESNLDSSVESTLDSTLCVESSNNPHEVLPLKNVVGGGGKSIDDDSAREEKGERASLRKAVARQEPKQNSSPIPLSQEIERVGDNKVIGDSKELEDSKLDSALDSKNTIKEDSNSLDSTNLKDSTKNIVFLESNHNSTIQAILLATLKEAA